MVKFDVSIEDAHLIRQIADRAIAMARKTLMQTKGRVDETIVSPVAWHMDITATHANGMPLRLRELLLADDFNFSHDVFGIRHHINRETGRLEGFFVPRFAQPESVKQ